jgi:hypothetical protein
MEQPKYDAGVTQTLPNLDRRTIRRMRRWKWSGISLTTFLILLSVVLFMHNKACEAVGNLIATQNDAALEIGINREFYTHEPEPPSPPPALITLLVKFARTNETLAAAVSKWSGFPYVVINIATTIGEIFSLHGRTRPEETTSQSGSSASIFLRREGTVNEVLERSANK